MRFLSHEVLIIWIFLLKKLKTKLKHIPKDNLKPSQNLKIKGQVQFDMS